MLIVSGRLQIRPGHRDAFLADSTDAVAQARAAAGCHDFVVAADPLDPDRVNVYERWETAADLERFRGQGPSSESMSVVVSGDVSRYEIASVGPA
ncbi:putative quinol monooxygenase [Patulibacter sp.]|uniref:putative quinol monooxygenase n=1 Tax=Patulibacter sp. TaxID=1912859 RepID=UPI00272574E4|nr:antibiotic biosynthesis monooxygenase family protein [Patulibacter sp.]MDO9408052.1 antibiotic biosynthesis monooxygenase family protein [Patulibacter sp.]